MPAAEPLTLQSLLSDLSQLAANPGLLPSSTPQLYRSMTEDLPETAPESADRAVALAEEFLAQSDDVRQRAEGVEALFARIANVEADAIEVRGGLQ